MPTFLGEGQRINSLAALRLREHNNFLKYLFSQRPAAGRRKVEYPWRPTFRREEQRINSLAALRPVRRGGQASRETKFFLSEK